METANIALECFGIIVSIVLLLCNIFEKPSVGKQTSLFSVMLIVNIAVLFCDLLTWVLSGRTDLIVLLYILNSLVYSLGYVMTAVFTYYLVNIIKCSYHEKKTN